MNELNFEFQRTDFINLREYDEIKHAEALFNGLPNFVNGEAGKQFDINSSLEITGGTAINNGYPLKIGAADEVKQLTLTDSFIYIKTAVNGLNSKSTIVESATILENTSNVFYFLIYEIAASEVVQDYRYINYIKDFGIKSVSDDEFVVYINGFTSDVINKVVIATGAGAYLKGESDMLFVDTAGDTMTGNLNAPSIGLGDGAGGYISRVGDNSQRISFKDDGGIEIIGSGSGTSVVLTSDDRVVIDGKLETDRAKNVAYFGSAFFGGTWAVGESYVFEDDDFSFIGKSPYDLGFITCVLQMPNDIWLTGFITYTNQNEIDCTFMKIEQAGITSRISGSLLLKYTKLTGEIQNWGGFFVRENFEVGGVTSSTTQFGDIISIRFIR